MSVVLWDVDTQRDFVLADGRLAVPGAEQALPAMNDLVQWTRTHGIVHVASADDHEHGDPEISDAPDFVDTYPPHCLRGTRGAEKVEETQLDDPVPLGEIAYPPGRLRELIAGRREILLLKKTFDVFANPNAEKVLDTLAPERVIVFGVATDVCNDAAIRGIVRRGYHVVFVEEASRGLDDERVEACTAAWRDLGVEFATVADVLATFTPAA
jgi:nicotinamidase/pyrazinamidase